VQPLRRRPCRDGRASVRRRTLASVAADPAEPVHTGLRLLHAQIVRQGAPPALRSSVIGLLHRTLAVLALLRADRDGHRVVLRNTGEGCGGPPRVGVADRRHPVKAPHQAHSAESAADPVEPVHDMWLRHRGCKHPAPFARIGERCDEQVRRRPPVPGGCWVRQIGPIPLCLFTRRVLDHSVRSLGGCQAGLADRP
jgi:hypothetical protein